MEQLVSAISHNKPSRLTTQQQQQLKQMVLHQRPSDYGIERNLWTGAILASVIEQRWGLALKDSRIYELLHQLGLSHQRGHRDYANADRQAQQQWVEIVKKTRLVKLAGIAVSPIEQDKQQENAGIFVV